MKRNVPWMLVVKTAIQCGLILGWSSVLYLILYVPRLLKTWEAAAGEDEISWRQQRLVDASVWIQTEFNAIWAFWAMGAFTFAYCYWRFGRPSRRATSQGEFYVALPDEETEKFPSDEEEPEKGLSQEKEAGEHGKYEEETES